MSQQSFTPVTLTPRRLTLNLPVPSWLRQDLDMSKDAWKRRQEEAAARMDRAMARMTLDLEARILAPMTTGEQQS